MGFSSILRPDFFGADVPRPGNMVDHLMKELEGKNLKLESLWRAY